MGKAPSSVTRAAASCRRMFKRPSSSQPPHPSPGLCGTQVHMFNVRGERLLPRFSLGTEVEEAGVETATIYRDGLAVLTPEGHLW